MITGKKDKWMVLFLREGTDRIRQLSPPAWAVRRGFFLTCALVGLLAGATGYFLFDIGTRGRAALLARENRLLVANLEQMRASVSELDRRIAVLAEKDRRVRLVAGLLEIDEEVLDVGVGGPGLESANESELWTLDREASEAAYAIRYDLAFLLRRADLLSSSFSETEDSLEERRERLRFTPSILPTNGPISSRFNVSRLHPVFRVYSPHEGIDQNAERGTPFVATADGMVSFAGWKPGLGNTIEIDHGFGATTVYGHASKLLVAAGARVFRGDVIGLVGCTGVCTGPHVHYEVHVDGRPVDPLRYVLHSVSGTE